MKNWNAPSVEELEVKLTAQGRTPDTVENMEGYLGENGFVFSTYNTNEWERDESDPTNPCLKPAKSGTES